jgi:hypothetical protein
MTRVLIRPILPSVPAGACCSSATTGSGRSLPLPFAPPTVGMPCAVTENDTKAAEFVHGQAMFLSRPRSHGRWDEQEVLICLPLDCTF